MGLGRNHGREAGPRALSWEQRLQGSLYIEETFPSGISLFCRPPATRMAVLGPAFRGPRRKRETEAVSLSPTPNISLFGICHEAPPHPFCLPLGETNRARSVFDRANLVGTPKEQKRGMTEKRESARVDSTCGEATSRDASFGCAGSIKELAQEWGGERSPGAKRREARPRGKAQREVNEIYERSGFPQRKGKSKALLFRHRKFKKRGGTPWKKF
jgi:hypothetical protein